MLFFATIQKVVVSPTGGLTKTVFNPEALKVKQPVTARLGAPVTQQATSVAQHTLSAENKKMEFIKKRKVWMATSLEIWKLCSNFI